ncbi:hypothetical protein [Pseudohoeflea coraliihabitans]|uniref:Flp pilus assembly protein CpaB n=1 Tax=Pseudohoeflea coraliihabitans TaxID=2860393 RepID=A0ABS6WSA8_9HYPH|nr:hypothetical protein [Pseudohoeflea sp. DP4N28-3]MBW3098843.1 hypothetical protein [Pseudohoeflea sp. DP4N28-3]
MRQTGGDRFVASRNRFANKNQDDGASLLVLVGMAAVIVIAGTYFLARSTGLDQQRINAVTGSAPLSASPAVIVKGFNPIAASAPLPDASATSDN